MSIPFKYFIIDVNLLKLFFQTNNHDLRLTLYTYEDIMHYNYLVCLL